MRDYLEKILLACAESFDVSIEDVRSTSRKQELVYCRKAFCLIAREELNIKYETIGKLINRSVNQVAVSISDQPADKFYIFCLNRAKKNLVSLL